MDQPRNLAQLANALNVPINDPGLLQLMHLAHQLAQGTLSPAQAQAALRQDPQLASMQAVVAFDSSSLSGTVAIGDVASILIKNEYLTINVLPAAPAPQAIPSNLPPRPSLPLIGQADLIGRLHKRLAEHPSRLALVGMPGVGKSRLALELAYDPGIQQQFPGGILFVRVGQRVDLHTLLHEYEQALELHPNPALSPAQQWERLVQRYHRTGLPFLIMIDDLWTEEQARLFVATSSLATVIYTTSVGELGTSMIASGPLVAATDVFTVEPLDADAALDLLYASSGLAPTSADPELTTLADLVGGLPVLLLTMGHYVRLQRPTQQRDWFTTTLQALEDAAQRLDLPTGAIIQARHNLQSGFFARFRRSPIKQPLTADLLIELSVSALPPNEQTVFFKLAALLPDPVTFGQDAVEAILGDSAQISLRRLVERHLLIGTADDRYRMHRVLQDWAMRHDRNLSRISAAHASLTRWHRSLAQAINEDRKQHQAWQAHPDNWRQLFETWRAAWVNPILLNACLTDLVPLLKNHAHWPWLIEGLTTALDHIPPNDHLLRAETNLQLSWTLWRTANYAAAHSAAQHALEGFTHIRRQDRQSEACYVLGWITNDVGAYDEAIGWFDQMHNLSDPEDAQVYERYITTKTMVLRDQGHGTQALALYRDGMLKLRQLLGIAPAGIHRSILNLRKVARRWAIARSAITIFDHLYGPHHPNTATCLYHLASLLHKQGQLGAARPLYERALAIEEQQLGPHHLNTATTLGNLARLLHDQDDFDAARPLFERARAIYEQQLGPHHPSTASTLGHLARLLHDQGDFDAARPLFERVLAIYEQQLGPHHSNTASTLGNLALLLHDQGDFDAARPLFERARAIDEQQLGPHHQSTATSLHNLARLLHDQGELDAARPLFERALAIYEQQFGPHHPSTASTLGHLARLLHDQGNFDAARSLFERALAIREQQLGLEHPHVAITLHFFARLLHTLGEDADARTLLDRALAIREQKLGLEHRRTIETRELLAEVVAALEGTAAQGVDDEDTEDEVSKTGTDQTTPE